MKKNKGFLLMPEPRDFKPLEKRRNKYLIDKLSGKFNIE